MFPQTQKPLNVITHSMAQAIDITKFIAALPYKLSHNALRVQ